MAREFTRDYIKSWIKRKLGFPLVEVELSDEQLEDCIDDAIEEIAPWVVQHQYVTLPASECIDVSEYDMAYVIAVHKASTNNSVNSKSRVDVFNPNSYSLMDSQRGVIYDRLEQILHTKSMLYVKDNISYRLINNRLFLDIGYPTSDKVTIEYSPKIRDLQDITEELYQKFIKRFSLAYARIILSDIRGKVSVSNSPIQLDASSQESKGSSELEVLREELKNTVNTHFTND